VAYAGAPAIPSSGWFESLFDNSTNKYMLDAKQKLHPAEVEKLANNHRRILRTSHRIRIITKTIMIIAA
jgi:hypothetical protein